ncbi:MAG: urease accessory UreF family protein [Alphaproteobacteria bacterium]
MTDASALATALQVADSQFPGGGFAFSWGLESLWREGQVERIHIGAFLSAQLHGRWASFDRAVVADAHGASLDHCAALDGMIEAMSWSAPLRDGSRRAGHAMLAAHARLGTPDAAEYRARKPDGHLPVVQGLVYAGLGLDRTEALTVSGMTFLNALASAAVRLNIVGALTVQGDVARLRHTVAALAMAEPPQQPRNFAPMADVAMSRHTSGGALFAN